MSPHLRILCHQGEVPEVIDSDSFMIIPNSRVLRYSKNNDIILKFSIVKSFSPAVLWFSDSPAETKLLQGNEIWIRPLLKLNRLLKLYHRFRS